MLYAAGARKFIVWHVSAGDVVPMVNTMNNFLNLINTILTGLGQLEAKPNALKAYTKGFVVRLWLSTIAAFPFWQYRRTVSQPIQDAIRFVEEDCVEACCLCKQLACPALVCALMSMLDGFYMLTFTKCFGRDSLPDKPYPLIHKLSLSKALDLFGLLMHDLI